VDEKFIVTYMQDAHEVLYIYNKDGSLDREVKLPTIGSINGVSAQREDTDFFFTFTSYTYPTTIYRYDLKSNEMTTHFAPKVTFNPAEYETVQKFATSKDGTKVPVFITHKKGLELGGDNPTLLGGYGGFNSSTTPSFSSSRVAWLERGGVYAQACMRGGGEYGEAWHRAGMHEKKQNVFDDFHAAAQLLIDEKYTSSKKLAIQGGSNGGLLVAACVLQKPDLYGAVVCQVPVADMLRYHKLGIGRFWTVEYGNAEKSADQFKYLYAYSPLHNVKPGMQLPPILITTGAGDNRVVPGHSYKLAATMQANASGANPILLRTEEKAGHGGGKPIAKVIRETADIYAFLMKVFEVK
jgi:prolyl oligopeptidase